MKIESVIEKNIEKLRRYSELKSVVDTLDKHKEDVEVTTEYRLGGYGMIWSENVSTKVAMDSLIIKLHKLEEEIKEM